jgi:DNA-binding NtrC family response regulator
MRIPEDAPISKSTTKAMPTVLVVDDDASSISALRRALRNEPYEILATDDPFQALDWLRTRSVDVVIADEFMPAMRGTELLEAATRWAPKSAKVVLTGYPAAAAAGPAGKNGANLVIQKPWEDELLRRSVRLLVEASRAHPS